MIFMARQPSTKPPDSQARSGTAVPAASPERPLPLQLQGFCRLPRPGSGHRVSASIRAVSGKACPRESEGGI
jgi:hypothetical protein